MQPTTQLKSLTGTAKPLKNQSPTEIAAFINACMNLDVGPLINFLDEDMSYEDRDKYLFLKLLKERFDIYKTKSPNLRVVHSEGTCKGCNAGKKVEAFAVVDTLTNETVGRFSYYFEYKNEEVTDIYLCQWFA